MFKKLVGLLTVTVAGLFLSGVASAQITDSAHDFTGGVEDAWNDTGEMCIVCHAPHNNNAAVLTQPLWNHDETAATFILYTGMDLQGAVGQPAGISKLCLSCHDGTVGLDSFGGIGTATDTRITGGALVGTDLSNDHPISITYVDPNLAATTDPTPLGGTIATDLLFSNIVECASCHDVHNTQNNSSLLKVPNTNSALCQLCHDK